MTTDQARENLEKIVAGVRQGVAEALEEHRRAGRKIVIWLDGKVVWMTVDDALRESRKRREGS